MTNPQSILISLPGEGQSLDPNGGLVCKVSADDTCGAYSMLELVLAPGSGTPLHIHHREEELVCVIEGELEVVDSAGARPALPGSVIRLPQGSAHALRNAGTTPCRLLITAIPGGLERYFMALNLALAAGEATPERLGEIAREFEIEFLA